MQREDRAWIDVDTRAIADNARQLAQHSGARLLPMVKADAYGLGVGPVVRTLESLDPWGYGVATVAEGEELRALGISRPIVLFTPALRSEHRRAHAARLTLALGDGESIAAWGAAGGDWHLAVDSGMGRAGVDWREVESLRDVIAANPPSGVFTHFHSAETDPRSVAEQELRFQQALAALPVLPPLVHTDNSAAIVRRGPSTLPVVRPGIFLYGAGAFPGARIQPAAVVSIRARIADVRSAHAGDTLSYGATHTFSGPATVATVPYGHADGYPIAASGRGLALLHGETVRVAGRVTMDMTMLDVTGVSCARGDVVTFAGGDGAQTVTLDDIAAVAATSPYELLVRMRNRIPRYYRG